MEDSKIGIKNKEFTQAEVPAAPHKIVQRLKIDTNIDVRDLYKEIIPLGLAEYFRINNINPAHYNFKIGVTNLAEGQREVNPH